MKNKVNVNIITLGCSKNTVDSERLMRQLKSNKFNLIDDPNKAEALIINTCGFIEAAKEESVNTILSAVELKKKGNIKKIIVAGCLSERYAKELKTDIPEVDAFFGTEKYEDILNELGGKLKRELLGERILSGPAHTAYLKISEGCDHPCSFCAIPLMRGLHISKPIEELVKEAEFLVKNKTRELIIIAQDTTDYGKDIYGERCLHKLLTELSNIEGVEWIRLMYAYPSHFPKEVINVIAQNKKICNYIDIPLQHISDSVLKSMRRGVTSERIRELVYKFRKNIPDVVLRTTFIVGYPNETEDDFKLLCNYVEEVKFDRIGVFTFSVEENTSSFILGNPVPEKIKEERKNILMEIQKEISFKKNKHLIGSNLTVLIERKEGDFYIGRSYRDAPEVDGEILMPVEDKNIEYGNFYETEIYDCNEYDLFGKIDK